MRYRTAVKTGRTAALQADALRPGSFLGAAAQPAAFRAENRAMSGLRAVAAWMLAVLLIAGTFAALDAQAQDKRPIADSAITLQVQRAIAQDRALDERQIRVQTHEGTVSLTGFVRSLEDIARAEELARAVRGVSGIRNGLQVANRPSRA